MIDFLSLPALYTGWIIFGLLWIMIVYFTSYTLQRLYLIRRAFIRLPKHIWHGKSGKWDFFKLYIVILLNRVGKMLIVDKEGDAHELDFKRGSAKEIDGSETDGYDI